MTDFVQPLVAGGFAVIAFDAPAHGMSKGKMSSAPEIAGTLVEVINRFGPVHGVIGHSLGAWAAILAILNGAKISSIVLIGAVTNPTTFLTGLAEILSLKKSVVDIIFKRAEKRWNFSMNDISLVRQLSHINTPALIIHDRDDSEVPLKQAEILINEWTGAQALITQGLGHRRILRDKDVIERAVQFFSFRR